MSEIRNLTRNGQTFYPQTHVEGVLDPEGNYIGNYEENPEYMKVELDNEGKILRGIKTDGTIVLGVGYEIDGNVTTTIDNPEFLVVYLDNENHILFGIRKDGSVLFGDVSSEFKDYVEQKLQPIKDKLTDIEDIVGDYIDNPEYVEVKTDFEDKILEAIRPDGTKVIPAGIDFGVAVFKGIGDPEGRMEIKTDSDERIISYRKEDGTLVENTGIETNHLELTNQGMTDFQQALKDAGFTPGGGGDWTDKSSMQIPIPQLAFVNITAPNGDAVWPISKTNDYKYYIEFYDGAGNYFKKEIIFNAQGRSSMDFEKKNGAVDICNNNGWDDDDTFKIKFGDWVSQDSFHFKAYYTDFFRGINVVVYNIADAIWKSRGIRSDRPWKKALIDFSKIGRDYRDSWNKDDMSLQMDNGARCIPDGFPTIFYLNGDFYGIYSWQLKKHRDNYHMKKDQAKHIHLDGNLNFSTLFSADGNPDNINWNPDNWQGFEIRNPKDLWTIAGEKYDADINLRQEPVDSITAETWISDVTTIPAGSKLQSSIIEDPDNPGQFILPDKIKKQLRYTGDTKSYILKLSKAIPTLYSMRAGGSTDAQIKEYFDTIFDSESIIDYLLLSVIIYNWDGFSSNWQYVTYDGKKWFICPYDCDNILGQQERGNYIMNVNATLFGNSLNLPTGWILMYYKNEISERWAEVKQLMINKMFVNNLYDWMNRIGKDNYDKEWKKWPYSPSNRNSNVNNDYWEFVGERTTVAPTGFIYDNNVNYVAFQTSETSSNTCWYKISIYWYKYHCVADCQGQKPILDSKVYPSATPDLGFHDSIWRAQNMINHLYNAIDNLIENL